MGPSGYFTKPFQSPYLFNISISMNIMSIYPSHPPLNGLTIVGILYKRASQ